MGGIADVDRVAYEMWLTTSFEIVSPKDPDRTECVVCGALMPAANHTMEDCPVEVLYAKISRLSKTEKERVESEFWHRAKLAGLMGGDQRKSLPEPVIKPAP